MTEVTFEPAFDADRFAFDPPEGATLNRSESLDTYTYETRDRLTATVGMTVPDPTVPTGYELVSASRIVGPEFTAVELGYRQGTSTLVVTKTTELSAVDISEGQQVSVGEVTGIYRSGGTEALVAWQCEGALYVVSGSVQQSTLLDVARSIACE